MCGGKNNIMNKIGLLAELTKRQTNRAYFSELPIGTKFIIVDEINTPAYDLTGYFLRCEPHILTSGKQHFTGYIEKDSWKIIGEIKDNIEALANES